jgi:EAL domain-containing protein (putative c-di-GMP-specific phosphodiesterase class I)
MLDHAEAALHDAKHHGRGRSRVFDQVDARRTGEEHRLALDLREALDHDALDVHYQPVHDLATDRIVGVEALARWNHPLGGVVPPGTFVPLAEAHGFVGELDRWVLERACRDVVAAVAEGLLPPDARVAVNLSARSLDERDLLLTVDRIVHRTGLPAAALVLEVTETAVLANRDAARAAIEGLRHIGVGVHLDDFGTGYSSLSFLRDLPVTGVKIDRSFVRDATGRPEHLAITEAVVRLTRGLGLDTVAEGIETVEQRDLLRELGCEHAQGFWWSPAVPLAELARRTATPALTAPTGPVAPVALVTASPAPRRWAFGRRTVAPAATAATAAGTAISATSAGTATSVTSATAAARTACCLRGGLESGQAWLVVADAARRESIARSLGPVHGHATARGLLVELDAFDTLRAVTGPDGRLDPVRFQQVVGGVLRRLGSAATQLGVHAELGQVNRPRRSVRVATDLRRRLQAVSDLVLEHVEDPAHCGRHTTGAGLPLPGLAAGGSTAS